MTLWIAGCGLALSAFVVLACRHVARHRAFANRPVLSLEHIKENIAAEVSPETVDEVWTRLGRIYSVRPGRIRPEDTLGAFRDVDSWELWAGDDSLAAWLRELGLEDKVSVSDTVVGFARMVQAARRRRN